MKRIVRPLLVGLCLGVVLSVIQHALHIEQGAFMFWFWIISAAVVVGAVLFNILYMGRYSRKIREAAALLEAGRPEEYLAATEALLRTARGRRLKACLRLNLSAGYYDLKRYDQAIAILEQLSQEPLKGMVKTIHQLNLCACCFKAGQTAKALELYEANQAEFSPLRTRPDCGGSVAVLDLFACIAQGRQDEAAKLLEHARATWTTSRLQRDYDYIEKLLAEAWPAKP